MAVGKMPYDGSQLPWPLGGDALGKRLVEVSGRFAGYVANTAALAAIPAAQRESNMLAITATSLYRYVSGAVSGDVAPDDGGGYWVSLNRGAYISIADAGGYLDGETIETAIQELGQFKVCSASKRIQAAAIAALGANQAGAIDFDAALPVGAVRLGAYVHVVTPPQNAGGTAVITCDVGRKNGDTDGWLDGASLAAAGDVPTPVGVLGPLYEGGITPTVTLASSVNCNTITVGDFTVVIPYLRQFV